MPLVREGDAVKNFADDETLLTLEPMKCSNISNCIAEAVEISAIKRCDVSFTFNGTVHLIAYDKLVAQCVPVKEKT